MNNGESPIIIVTVISDLDQHERSPEPVCNYSVLKQLYLESRVSLYGARRRQHNFIRLLFLNI